MPKTIMEEFEEIEDLTEKLARLQRKEDMEVEQAIEDWKESTQ